MHRLTIQDQDMAGASNDIPKKHAFHAFLTYAEDDKEKAEEIYATLTDRDFAILEHSRDFIPGVSVMKNIEDATKQSRWVIHLVSHKWEESNYSQLEENVAIVSEQEEKLVKRIFLIHEMGDDIPGRYSMTTFIRTDQADVYEQLEKALKGDDVIPGAALPCGNVATGLAWSYFYGYLTLMLPMIPDLVKKSIYYKGEYCISTRLIILIPKSCRCPAKLSELSEEIAFEGHIEPVHEDRAGVVGRSYKCSVYSVTLDKTKEKYYLVGEFATPILSLWKMAEGEIAGLSHEEKTRQVNIFYNTLSMILAHPNSKACHDNYNIITYDDEKVPMDGSYLVDVIKKLIVQDKQLKE